MASGDVSLKYLLFGEDKTASQALDKVARKSTETGKIMHAVFHKLGHVIGHELGRNLGLLGTTFGVVGGQIGGEFGTVLATVGGNIGDILTLVDAGIGTLFKSAAAWVAHAAAIVWNTTVTVIASAATKAWAAVQWLLNAALAANPIGLVVAAIALLIGAIVLAYTHSETFRKIIDAAWHGIVTVVSWAWNYYFKPYLTAWWTIIKDIGHIAQFLWLDIMVPAFKGIVKIIQWAWGLVQPILNVWKGILDGLVNAMHAVGDFVTGATGKASAASIAAHAGQQTKAPPTFKGRASGGPAFAGATYRVNEAGQEFLTMGGKSGWIGGGGGGGTTVVFSGTFLASKAELARYVGQALDESIGNGTFRPRRLAITAH